MSEGSESRVVPRGIFAEPKAVLRAMLSETAAWVEWVGADWAADAAARIFTSWAKADDLTEQMPLAVCALQPKGNKGTAIAGGAALRIRHSGQVWLAIKDKPRYGDSDDSVTDFENRFSDVITEICDVSGVDDHLAITDYYVEEPPALVGIQGEGRLWMQGIVVFQW